MWTFHTVDTLLGHRKKSHRLAASTSPLSCHTSSCSPPIISPFCSYECSDKFHLWQVLWAGWCKQTGLKGNTTAGRKIGKPQVPSSPQSVGLLSLASTKQILYMLEYHMPQMKILFKIINTADICWMIYLHDLFTLHGVVRSLKQRLWARDIVHSVETWDGYIILIKNG
jgi:hypothetical protein